MHPINRDATIKYQSITRLHLVKHIEQLKTAPNISLSVQIFFSSSIKKKTLSYKKKGEPTQNIVLFKKKKKNSIPNIHIVVSQNVHQNQPIAHPN